MFRVSTLVPGDAEFQYKVIESKHRNTGLGRWTYLSGRHEALGRLNNENKAAKPQRGEVTHAWRYV
jgi:hypothetical protein